MRIKLSWSMKHNLKIYIKIYIKKLNRKTTVLFFSDFQWHDSGFLVNIVFIFGFLGKLPKKYKIWQEIKRSKIWLEIQDYPRSWLENPDAKQWGVNFSDIFLSKVGKSASGVEKKLLQLVPTIGLFFDLYCLKHYLSAPFKKSARRQQ